MQGWRCTWIHQPSIFLSLIIICQEPKPEDNLWAGRTARKFESFGRPQKQQQQQFPNFPNKKQNDREQQQWDKIYDTFNNWDDDVNDDWNNRLDHETSDTRQDDWSDDLENQQHFADFQFEIKKLSEMYSGSEHAPGPAPSQSSSFSRDKSSSLSRRQPFSSGDRDNVRSRGTPRPRYSDLRRDEETAGRPDNFNQLRPSDENIGRADSYNFGQNTQSYERPEFQWAKAEVTTRAPVYENRNMVRQKQQEEEEGRPVRMVRRPLTPAQTSGSLGVLPAPAEFQENTRRVSGHFYDDADTANFQFDPSPNSFENSYQYQNNPIGNEFQQNDIWNDIEKNTIYQTPDPAENSVGDRYPYPYQKPAFNEPEFEYNIKPISPVTPREPEAVYRIKPKTNIKRKTESVMKTKSNSFLNLDEATLILSEPHISRRNEGLKKSSASVPTLTKVRAESEDTSSSLKERPRGYRRVEDSYRDYRRGSGSQEPRLPDASHSHRGHKRMEDSVGGESYHHGVSPDHHGGLEAAVVAGANHYRAEHYDQPQRLAFQIHGQEGPKSYRFGHDTGVG